MFQSLLFWIIGSGYFDRSTVGDLFLRFQSLLFWIIGSGKIEMHMVECAFLFQSLLFWIIGSGNGSGKLGA